MISLWQITTFLSWFVFCTVTENLRLRKECRRDGRQRSQGRCSHNLKMLILSIYQLSSRVQVRHSNILIFSPETVNAVVYFIFIYRYAFSKKKNSHQLLSGLSWRRRRTGCNSNSRWTPSKENLEIRTGIEVLNNATKQWKSELLQKWKYS